MSATRRVFIGLRPPTEVARELHDEAHAALASLPERWLRFAAAPDLHVTILFLGAVAEARISSLEHELERAASESPALELEIRGAGAFPSMRRPRVLWAGVSAARAEDRAPDELRTAVVRAAASAGCEVSPRESSGPFRPHITLARVRLALRRPLPDAFAALAFRARWRASELILFESRSDTPSERYPALACWPLRPNP
jgi:2'-5' RNA ligase